jgi:hypothetical protein|tara:strand:+ start:200 stop:418 length:219 start_codon:yes stop_codon:yes gene_type:complete
MDKEMDKFLNEIADNTPHSEQFEEMGSVNDFEEDLLGGKSFKSMRKENKKGNGNGVVSSELLQKVKGKVKGN